MAASQGETGMSEMGTFSTAHGKCPQAGKLDLTEVEGLADLLAAAAPPPEMLPITKPLVRDPPSDRASSWASHMSTPPSATSHLAQPEEHSSSEPSGSRHVPRTHTILQQVGAKQQPSAASLASQAA